MNDTLLVICLGIALAGSVLLAASLRRQRRWRDPRRKFNRVEKQALLARAGHRCEHKPLLWSRCRATTLLEADHVVPWSSGGRTQLQNGSILCRRHNRRKSGRIPSALYRWRLGRRQGMR